MNKAIIIGNLGGDPMVNHGPNGFSVTKFNVATSERWRDKVSGELQERPEWHRVAVFGKLAEICEKYLSRGKKVCVEGRLQTSKYEKDGITRYSTEIIASNVQFLSPKSSDSEYDLQATENAYDSKQQQSNSEEEKIPF